MDERLFSLLHHPLVAASKAYLTDADKLPITLAAVLTTGATIGVLVDLLQKINDKPIHDLFAVPLHRSRLVAADIGGRRPKVFYWNGIRGTPDAAFIMRRGLRRHGVVCDYKSRRFNGRISDYERYQIILYMGIFRALYRLPSVEGRIRYADQLVTIAWDSATFNWLVGLRQRCLHETPAQ